MPGEGASEINRRGVAMSIERLSIEIRPEAWHQGAVAVVVRASFRDRVYQEQIVIPEDDLLSYFDMYFDELKRRLRQHIEVGAAVPDEPNRPIPGGAWDMAITGPSQAGAAPGEGYGF